MSQDLARPAWMGDRLGEAITRLTTRIGDAGFTALTKAAMLAGQWRAEHTASSKGRDHFDLKRDPGGIVDIEFMVQYLVLAHAGEHAELTIWSDVIRLLEALEQTGLIAADQAESLSQAYLDYRSATHTLGLQGLAVDTDAAEFEAQRQQVKRITEALLPGLQAG